MGEYQPPSGALDVAIPRTPTRIVLQTCLIHLFADYTYTYLCELIPRLRTNSFNERCIQVLLFWHVPSYFFMQLATTLLAAGLEQFDVEQPLGLIQFASLAGLQRFKSRVFIEEAGVVSWVKAGVLGVALSGCWIGSNAYIERFGISYHAASDVGMLGIDHRNGWTAFGGLFVGCIGAVLRAYFWFKAKRIKNAEAERGSATNRQQLEKDEDEFDYETCEVPLLDMSLDHAVTLVEAFSAAVIHQIPLVATHRAISIVNFLPASLILIAVLVVLALRQSRPSIAKRATQGLKLVPMIVIGWTMFEPSLHDLNELYDASATMLTPWSFRWLVTDRFDRMLRPFV